MIIKIHSNKFSFHDKIIDGQCKSNELVSFSGATFEIFKKIYFCNQHLNQYKYEKKHLHIGSHDYKLAELGSIIQNIALAWWQHVATSDPWRFHSGYFVLDSMVF